MAFVFPMRRLRYVWRRKYRQVRRLSRKSVPLVYLLVGAGLVAAVSIAFARMAEFALEQNAQIILEYFQALEKRIAKKWAKDEDFAKVSDCVFGNVICILHLAAA